MATETCPCPLALDYDPDTVNVPTSIPDLMCAICGIQLTQEQVDSLPPPPIDNQP